MLASTCMSDRPGSIDCRATGSCLNLLGQEQLKRDLLYILEYTPTFFWTVIGIYRYPGKPRLRFLKAFEYLLSERILWGRREGLF